MRSQGWNDGSNPTKLVPWQTAPNHGNVERTGHRRRRLHRKPCVQGTRKGRISAGRFRQSFPRQPRGREMGALGSWRNRRRRAGQERPTAVSTGGGHALGGIRLCGRISPCSVALLPKQCCRYLDAAASGGRLRRAAVRVLFDLRNVWSAGEASYNGRSSAKPDQPVRCVQAHGGAYACRCRRGARLAVDRAAIL